jgi:hypothetical protein
LASRISITAALIWDWDAADQLAISLVAFVVPSASFLTSSRRQRSRVLLAARAASMAA